MSNEIVPFQEVQQMAAAIYKSQLFPSLKTEAQALGLMLLSQAEGVHPMMALRRYHIMSDGKPSMRADAMLASYRARGGKVVWLTKADDEKKQIGKWIFEGNEQEIGFTIEEAERAGYLQKQGTNWWKDRAAQLRARAITRAVRMLCPEVVAGLYTPEELEDVSNTSSPQHTTATVIGSEPLAPAAASNKTEAAKQAEAAQPGESREDFEKRMRHLRGKLNQALLPVTDAPGFKKVRQDFVAAHGKDMEGMRTYHDDKETFYGLMQEHWKRISNEDGIRRFLDDLSRADIPAFNKLVDAYLANANLQVQNVKDAVDAKGRSLGHPDYVDQATGEVLA